MNKKDRFKLEHFNTELSAKIDNYKFKNKFIVDSDKIFINLTYKEINLEQYFKLLFGRRKEFNKLKLGEINLNNLELPFEEVIGESQNTNNFIYNAIILDIKKGSSNKSWVITKSLKELEWIRNKSFVITSPLTYIGRNRNSNNSRNLYAITIDLDYVGALQIRDLFQQINTKFLPVPNIITNSGNGLHLTYLIDNAIPLYKETKDLLNRLKYGLTDKIWNQFTSQDPNRQYQNILQAYRVPESLTKFGERITCFYNINSHYYNIEELNEFISKTNEEHPPLSDEELSIIFKIRDKKYKHSSKIEEAKEKWPEWYLERIVNNKPRNYIKYNKGLYNWWLNKLLKENEVTLGHRYYCALALVSFATKCNIPKKEVKKDLYSLLDKFDNLTLDQDNHFLKEDIDDALKLYGTDKAHKFKSEFISKQCGIKIKQNKRNGQKRSDHLKYLHESNKLKMKVGLIKRPKQYKSKNKNNILNYIRSNPHSYSVSSISRDLKISPTTVRKWLQECKYLFENENINNSESIYFKGKQWDIYSYLKENKIKRVLSKRALSKEMNLNYVTICKYYDKIIEVLEKEEFWENLID